MSSYKCGICGYVFNEEPGKTFADLEACPVCTQPKDVFEPIDQPEESPVQAEPASHSTSGLDYDSSFSRVDPSVAHMDEIHKINSKAGN